MLDREMIGESKEQRRRRRMEDALSWKEAENVVPGKGLQAWLDQVTWKMCRQRTAGSWHWGGPIVLLATFGWRDAIDGDLAFLVLDIAAAGLIALRAQLLHERYVARTRQEPADYGSRAERRG